MSLIFINFAVWLLDASKKKSKKTVSSEFFKHLSIGKKLLNFFVLLFYFVVTVEHASVVSLLQQVALQWVNSVFK